MHILAAGALLLSILTGEITYYRDGLMEIVYRNRLAWGHVEPCERCIGMIALVEPGQVGKVAYLTRPGQRPEGPFLIVDTGTFRTPGRVAEVDFATARRWEMAGPLADVTVFVMEDHHGQRKEQ